MLSYVQILILALIQGACELLPVSSSAHVIAAEKLMHLDPSSPEMTMLDRKSTRLNSSHRR